MIHRQRRSLCTQTINSHFGAGCGSFNRRKTERVTNLAPLFPEKWQQRLITNVIIITTIGSCRDLVPRCSEKWAFVAEARKNCKRRCSDVLTQPTSLCRWDRLSSSVCNPARLSPLWGSFVFLWQGYNNQAPPSPWNADYLELSLPTPIEPFNASLQLYPLWDINQGLRRIYSPHVALLSGKCQCQRAQFLPVKKEMLFLDQVALMTVKVVKCSLSLSCNQSAARTWKIKLWVTKSFTNPTTHPLSSSKNVTPRFSSK